MNIEQAGKIKKKNGTRQLKLKTYRCVCKEEEHTVDINQDPWRQLSIFIKELGEVHTIVIMGSRSYRVPRIYIAKHGIQAIDLPKIGFPYAEWSLEKQAEQMARVAANHASIETTSEGKSFLHASYLYWIKKLAVE